MLRTYGLVKLSAAGNDRCPNAYIHSSEMNLALQRKTTITRHAFQPVSKNRDEAHVFRRSSIKGCSSSDDPSYVDGDTVEMVQFGH